MQEAFNSGIALGMSGLFVKTATVGLPLDATLLLKFFLSPLSFFALAFGAYGLLYMQIALHKSDVTFVIPLVSALSVSTPIILATVFLGEYVPVVKWLGILLILIGTVGITKSSNRSFLSTLTGGAVK